MFVANLVFNDRIKGAARCRKDKTSVPCASVCAVFSPVRVT